MTTSYAYESLSLDAVKQWFSDMQKEVHVLGPLLPSGYGIKTQNGEEGTSVDIKTFLGEMLIRHGERSVFFVRSFPFLLISYIILLRFPLALTIGHQFRNTLTNWSNLWSQRKHHLYAYSCFLRYNLSFRLTTEYKIFSYAPPSATLSDRLAERIQSSGLGMATKWSPQQFILNHPVLHRNCCLSRADT